MKPLSRLTSHSLVSHWRGLVAVGVSLLALIVAVGVGGATATLPVLWTAGGLSAGGNSAGQSARLAVDASGNVTVVSGPGFYRMLVLTSYTSTGVLRWQRSVAPSSGTFVGDWVVAAPNGDLIAIGHNQDSHGRPIASTMVRYASDGTLQWRVDFSSGFFPQVSRLLVDAGGNAYVAWSAVGSGLFVQKYSPSGALLWSQTDSTSGGYAVATSLALSPDGADVVATGDVPGGAMWITAAFNAVTGALRWHVAAAEGIAALDVVVDATRVYVTGEGNVGINGFLTVVAYSRATGARLWRTDANAPTCCAIGQRIALAPNGSLVVAGHTATGGYFDWWIVAMNPNGSVKWKALRNRAVSGDEIPAAVFVLADGTAVVSGVGGPPVRDILGNSYLQGVTAGYSPTGSLLWEGFSKVATVWAAALPSGNVCATGGYDALTTCFAIPAAATTPVNTMPPTVSGPAISGQTLTATAGSWTGSPAPTFAFQWQRCDSSGLSCSPIGLATGSSYTLVPADVGSTIRVQVTGTNTVGSLAVSSSPTAVVTVPSGIGPTTPVLDSFNRANGAVGSNWSLIRPTGFAGLNVLGNALVDASASLFAWDFWNQATFGPDSEAYVTVKNYGASDTIRIGARVTNGGTTSQSGYYVAVSSAGAWLILRVDSGVSTTLASGVTQGLVSGDKIAIRVVGTVVTALHFAAGSWQQLLSYNTSADSIRYTAAGKLALEFKSSTLDDFGGGTI